MSFFNKYILPILALFIGLEVSAQYFEADYIQQTNYAIAEISKNYTLIFGKNKSFYFSDSKSELVSENEIKRVSNDELNYFMIDLLDKSIVYNQPIMNRVQYVKENLPLFSWKILNEYDEFNKIKVQKAETNFRGRDYVAWFSVDYKIPIGPWKFSGLPGLLIKIKSLDNEVDFELKKIKEITESDFRLKAQKINELISKNKSKEMSWESYKQEYHKFLDKMLKNMKSDSEPGDEYNINLYLIEDIGWGHQ